MKYILIGAMVCSIHTPSQICMPPTEQEELMDQWQVNRNIDSFDRQYRTPDEFIPYQPGDN